MKLLNVDTLEAAVEKIRSSGSVLRTETEYIELETSCGRIAAADISSSEMIPPYRRSIVDGYAIRSTDVKAAGEMIPAILRQIGEVEFGCFDEVPEVESGTCVYVPTGGMIPEGADAMIMIEYTDDIGNGRIAVGQSVAPGNQVVQIGEDIKAGEVLLNSGDVIRPQDVGVLAACGITEVPVFRRLHVTVISTGDELVGPNETPLPGQIRDINTYSLAAMLEKEGMIVDKKEKLPDDELMLRAALERAKTESDVVIVSGGSSQGKKDSTGKLIGEVCDRGVLTHGLAVKPGKPTITGIDEATGTLFIGLPGHPAAAMMIMEHIFIDLWNEKTGRHNDRIMEAEAFCNIPASPGRRTFQLVKIVKDNEGNKVQPVLAKSGMILAYAKADGYIVMTENQEGVREGDTVEVHLWRQE